jgi:flagellar biosynthesis chaperone FliJ
MALFEQDILSASKIPSYIRGSKVNMIPEFIKEHRELVKLVDKLIIDFTGNKEWWQEQVKPGLNDKFMNIYEGQIKTIDENIDKLNKHKTKLNQIIERWNYVMKKNKKSTSKALFDRSKELFGKLRKLKKDMISDMSKPQKPVKRTKRGKRTKRR